jgi:uncharacterized protein YuzE
MTRFEYHKKDDIAVFEYGDYDAYERSIDVANFVVDINSEGDFLGLEVIGASERLPLTKEELSNIEDIEIVVKDDEESMMVTITLRRDEKETSLNLPMKGITGQPA